MRKGICALCIVVMTVFCFGLVSPGLCASRFSEGFQEIKWGTPKENLPDLGIGKSAFENIYAKGPSATLFMEGVGNLKMQFEEIPLIAIYLRFQDARFTGFDFVFNPQLRDRMRVAMEKDMGKPGEPCTEGLCWKEGTLDMTLTDRELLVMQKLNP